MSTENQQLAAAEKIANREPEDEAECPHQWNCVGTAEDGTQFFECANCGEESES